MPPVDVLWKADPLREEKEHKEPLLLQHGRELQEHPAKLVVEEPADLERGTGSNYRYYVLQ
jgi:hypothetical protein